MNKVFSYGDEKIAYQVTPSEVLLEKIRIHVHPNADVEVQAPKGHCPEEIHRAVLKRKRWIHNQLKAVAELRKYSLPREYKSGETHFYIGRRYQLKITEKMNTQSAVKLRAGRIEVTLHINNPEAVRTHLRNWYKTRAEDFFSRRTNNLLKSIPWIKIPPRIKITPMKKQWGSCSPSGSIHFNPWLLRAPIDCIDYVIIHELCHLRERNHSKKYYELLNRYYPDWQPVKTKLDAMAELLLAE